jgi:hypothetical protein
MIIVLKWPTSNSSCPATVLDQCASSRPLVSASNPSLIQVFLDENFKKALVVVQSGSVIALM